MADLGSVNAGSVTRQVGTDAAPTSYSQVASAYSAWQALVQWWESHFSSTPAAIAPNLSANQSANVRQVLIGDLHLASENLPDVYQPDGYIYALGTDDPHQCVALVRALAQLGPATHWTQGTTLPSTSHDVPAIGTPIATFNASIPGSPAFYPSSGGKMLDSQGNALPRADGAQNNWAHAAIFLGYITSDGTATGQIIGMKILDQSSTERASVTDRYFPGAPPSLIPAGAQMAGYPYSVVIN
jgi:hypothetical protein